MVAQHCARVLVDDGAGPLAEVLRQELAMADLHAGTAKRDVCNHRDKQRAS